MNRRGFLAGILSAGFAPAAIGSVVLMPVRRIAAPSLMEAFDMFFGGDSAWQETPPHMIHGQHIMRMGPSARGAG